MDGRGRVWEAVVAGDREGVAQTRPEEREAAGRRRDGSGTALDPMEWMGAHGAAPIAGQAWIGEIWLDGLGPPALHAALDAAAWTLGARRVRGEAGGAADEPDHGVPEPAWLSAIGAGGAGCKDAVIEGIEGCAAVRATLGLDDGVRATRTEDGAVVVRCAGGGPVLAMVEVDGKGRRGSRVPLAPGAPRLVLAPQWSDAGTWAGRRRLAERGGGPDPRRPGRAQWRGLRDGSQLRVLEIGEWAGDIRAARTRARGERRRWWIGEWLAAAERMAARGASVERMLERAIRRGTLGPRRARRVVEAGGAMAHGAQAIAPGALALWAEGVVEGRGDLPAGVVLEAVTRLGADTGPEAVAEALACAGTALVDGDEEERHRGATIIEALSASAAVGVPDAMLAGLWSQYMDEVRARRGAAAGALEAARVVVRARIRDTADEKAKAAWTARMRESDRPVAQIAAGRAAA